jgi:transposase
MSTNPNRRPYPPEFRRDAVALYRRSGHSLRDVAEDLGVSLESLRHPNKQLDVDEGRAEGLSSAERDELARLRRENRTLREEREVLRKAAAFFATESERR